MSNDDLVALGFTRITRRRTPTSRRARPRWRRSRRAGGGSSAVEADDRGGSNQHRALLERQDYTLVAWYPSLYAPRAGGAYDSHHQTAGIAGRTRRRGSRANDFGTPGVIENCHFIDDIGQALLFSDRLRSRVLMAIAARTDLHLVIVGGGATGVELAAELSHH